MVMKSFEWEVTHCSLCGGEYDSEGWCPNYCTNDEKADEPRETK